MASVSFVLTEKWEGGRRPRTPWVSTRDWGLERWQETQDFVGLHSGLGTNLHVGLTRVLVADHGDRKPCPR